MILEILLPLLIILYWFSEGVTEGYTWAKAKRRKENKLIHPNNGKNGIMDYHGWRIFENLGIWGTVITAYFMKPCCDVPVKSFFLFFCLAGFYQHKVGKPSSFQEIQPETFLLQKCKERFFSQLKKAVP